MNKINKEQISSYMSDWLNDKLSKQESPFSSNNWTPMINSIDDYIKYFRLNTSEMEYLELIIESSDKIKTTTKINLINNIEYDDNRIDMDGEPQVIRIFSLENENGVKFFTAEGSNNHVVSLINGKPQEHTKEDFFKLLDSHKALNNNHFVKYMKSVILHNEFEKDLSKNDVKKKQLKL